MSDRTRSGLLLVALASAALVGFLVLWAGLSHDPSAVTSSIAVDGIAPPPVEVPVVLMPQASPLAPLSEDAAGSAADQIALTIVVESEHGGRVGGAGIFILQEPSEEWRRLGTARKDGTLELSTTPSEAVTIGVSACGFQGASVTTDARTNREVLVTLAGGSVLSGRVAWVGGESADPAEVPYVVAVPIGQGSSKSADTVEAALGPLSCRGDVLNDGRFTIYECNPALSYQLSAGGRGVISTARPTALRQSQELRVEVARLFACIVQLEDASGSPLRAFPTAYGATGVSLKPINSQFAIKAVWPSLLDCLLAELDVAVCPMSQRDYRLWAYAGDHDVESLGTFLLSVDIPGYERLSQEVQLAWAGHGVQTVTVRLQPSSSGFGAVTVLIDGLPPGPESTIEPFARLRLEPADSQHGAHVESFDAGVDWPSDGRTIRIEGVPSGSYVGALEVFAAKHFFELPGPIEVAPGETATVTCDLSGSGSASIVIRDGSGTPLKGGVAVQIQSAEDAQKGRQGRFVSFDRLPFVVAGLPEGEWTFSPSAALPVAGGMWMRATAHIKAGQLTDVPVAPGVGR